MARLILATLWLLCACKRDAPERQRLRVQLFGDPAELVAYRELVTAFEARHPGISVELSPVGRQREYMQKLATAFSGGVPPDVFLVNYRRFGQLAAKGVLEPLGPLLGRGVDLELSELYPQPVEAFRVGGTPLCLPQNVSSLVVYVNRALFRQKGVPLPKEGWTWEELRGAARSLTDRSAAHPAQHVHGLGLEPSLARLAPFLWQAGAEVVNRLEAPAYLPWQTPQAKEALRFVLALRRLDQSTPSLEEVTAEDLESRFARGKLAMLLQSRRFVATAREAAGLDWDVAPLPRHREAATLLHSDAYCVARGSKAKRAAYAFISYALGPEGAERLARSGRTVPSLRAVAESPAFLDPSQRPASARVFLEALEDLRRLPNTPTWYEIETRSDPVIEDWYYGADLTRFGLSGPPPGLFPGSMKGAVGMGDEVTVLPRELHDATAGLWSAE